MRAKVEVSLDDCSQVNERSSSTREKESGNLVTAPHRRYIQLGFIFQQDLVLPPTLWCRCLCGKREAEQCENVCARSFTRIGGFSRSSTSLDVFVPISYEPMR